MGTLNTFLKIPSRHEGGKQCLPFETGKIQGGRITLNRKDLESLTHL